MNRDHLTIIAAAACLAIPTVAVAQPPAKPATVKWGTPIVPTIGTITADDVKSTPTGNAMSVILNNTPGVNLSGSDLTGAATISLTLPVTAIAPEKISKYEIQIRAGAKKTAASRLAIMIDTGSSTWTVDYGYGQTAPTDLIIPVTARYTGTPLALTITVTAQRKFATQAAMMQIDTVDVKAVTK